MYYRQQLIKGALFILVSEFMFASMGASVKSLSHELPNEMLVFIRNLAGLLLLSGWLLKYGTAQLKTRLLHFHLLRASLGLAAMYCFFYALANLALAEGLLLKMTSPFFLPFIAALWLRESLPSYALAALPVGFAGVVFILRPGDSYNWIALIGLLGGFLAAFAKVTVRRLSRTEPTYRIVFYFSFIATLLSAIPLLWSWKTPSPESLFMLVLMGLCGTLGQLFLTRAYGIAQIARIAPFTYFSVVYGSLYGFFIWGETLDMYFIIGALLIMLAGLMALKTGPFVRKQSG